MKTVCPTCGGWKCERAKQCIRCTSPSQPINVIREMREAGAAYEQIADVLLVTRERVRQLCKKHGIKKIAATCAACGAQLPPSSGGGKYCSDECRNKLPCIKCGKLRDARNKGYCWDCSVKARTGKRPSPDEMAELICRYEAGAGYWELGREFGYLGTQLNRWMVQAGCKSRGVGKYVRTEKTKRKLAKAMEVNANAFQNWTPERLRQNALKSWETRRRKAAERKAKDGEETVES